MYASRLQQTRTQLLRTVKAASVLCDRCCYVRLTITCERRGRFVRGIAMNFPCTTLPAAAAFRRPVDHACIAQEGRRAHAAQQRSFHRAQTTLQGAACHRDRTAGQREERMRGRPAGQPLNRVFEPSLSPGLHAGAAFSADGQLFTTSSLLQCDRAELQQLLLRAQAAQKST